MNALGIVSFLEEAGAFHDNISWRIIFSTAPREPPYDPTISRLRSRV